MKQNVFLGIDLGGTNCRGGLVTPQGKISDPARMATRIDEGLAPFLQRLISFCESFQERCRAEGRVLQGIGLGIPGVIDAAGTVTASPNLHPLEGQPLAGMLSQRLGVPVIAVNDANAFALGEGRFGAGRPFASFLTLTLGTGVGGGLILNKRLWSGADGVAGEVGHIMVEAQGRPCGCGSRGCLEQYASASGIVESVRLALARGERSCLNGTALTSAAVAAAARQGDTVAQEAFAEAGRRLGQVLAGIANLLNLEGAVITGGASPSLDLMLPALQGEFLARTFKVPAERFQIVRGQLGDDGGILGSAGLAIQACHSPNPCR